MFGKRSFLKRRKPARQHDGAADEKTRETPFIPPVQPKLTMGQPGDVFEQEADRTADAVVQNMDAENSLQAQPLEEEEEMIQPQVEEEEEEELIQPQMEEEEEIQARPED